MRGADGHVGLGLADALGDRAGGVADLESHVPQAIEDGLGDRLAPRRLLVRQEKEQIDVGARRQHAAAVAAGGDDRHVLGFGRVLRGIKVLGGEIEQHANDLVLHETEPLRAAPPVPVLDQEALGSGPALLERSLEAPGDQEPELALVAGMGLGQAFEVGRDGVSVEDFPVAQALVGRSEHRHRDSGARAMCHRSRRLRKRYAEAFDSYGPRDHRRGIEFYIRRFDKYLSS